MHLLWDQNNDEVTLAEEGQQGPPLTDTQLKCWLELDNIYPTSPASMAHQLSWEARQAIRRQAYGSPDDNLRTVWSRAAARYAAFTNPNGQWDLRLHGVVHRQPLRTWALEGFVVTNVDMRFFLLCDGGVVTAAEFAHLYGCTLPEHLNDYRDNVAVQIEQYLVDIMAPLRHLRVTVGRQDGSVETREIMALTGAPISCWAEIREGETVLDKQTV